MNGICHLSLQSWRSGKISFKMKLWENKLKSEHLQEQEKNPFKFCENPLNDSGGVWDINMWIPYMYRMSPDRWCHITMEKLVYNILQWHNKINCCRNFKQDTFEARKSQIQVSMTLECIVFPQNHKSYFNMNNVLASLNRP